MWAKLELFKKAKAKSPLLRVGCPRSWRKWPGCVLRGLRDPLPSLVSIRKRRWWRRAHPSFRPRLQKLYFSTPDRRCHRAFEFSTDRWSQYPRVRLHFRKNSARSAALRPAGPESAWSVRGRTAQIPFLRPSPQLLMGQKGICACGFLTFKNEWQTEKGRVFAVPKTITDNRN